MIGCHFATSPVLKSVRASKLQSERNLKAAEIKVIPIAFCRTERIQSSHSMSVAEVVKVNVKSVLSPNTFSWKKKLLNKFLRLPD